MVQASATLGTNAVVIHAVYSGHRLHLWAERAFAPAGGAAHPGAFRPEGIDGVDAEVGVRLPAREGRVLPSSTLAIAMGAEHPEGDGLVEVTVPTVSVDPGRVGVVLESLAERAEDSDGSLLLGSGVVYFDAAARLARHLLAGHRFVPMMLQDGDGNLSASWWPWLADEMTARRVALLISSMPAAARAAVDEHAHDAWSVTLSFLASVTDAACRRTLIAEAMNDTLEDTDPKADPQVAWLNGLLDSSEVVPAPTTQRAEITKRVRRWIGSLEERGESSAWRLGFRLSEPIADGLDENIQQPDDTVAWSLSFYLESCVDPEVVVEAADVWLLSRDSVVVQGLTLDSPQELLMAELGRASRYDKKLEEVLDESEPIEILLKTKEAYRFLREVRPVLKEQGFSVQAPAWWDSPAGRLGARLRIESDPAELIMQQGGADASGPQLGLGTLVGYHWEIAIGDTTLTLHEFEQFASKSSPLVRIGGKWVEIRPEDVTNAIKFIKENPGGEMELGEAMRLALATDPSQTGVAVTGLHATGWVASIFGGGDSEGVALHLPDLQTPERFRGTLRPYQQRGLSWMAFMERFGFGVCLADDMGLGKTVQLIALLQHERSEADGAVEGHRPAPTLLVVPMSVIGNWVKETERFAPELDVLVHHGPERLQGTLFVEEAKKHDLVLTTYALIHRDRELFEAVPWGRMVLDEAQFVKNPQAKQSQAVRAIPAPRRIALTGTPVENRLSELWSIMDFLNPGYLGPAGNFRRKFSVPIERHRDRSKMDRLRSLVRPFILRRVKTDPTVAADLPEKLESREWCPLTSEQAALYESCVKRMLTEVEQSEGIHRRGLVLAALIKLKQICNHPAQMLKDQDPQAGRIIDPSRSGKCVRLLEMLDEVLSEGDQALVFTQFRQMGHLLSGMVRHELGREVLFLHGGTPQGQRQKMIETFQEATGKNPILILSLKAGGVGLNLTAANHVFHFDRWWNPAVENQATDRAFRIGQTRTVQVHKFVVRGTLEERIDEMIESKTELAENIIGHGERWLTELDTDQLRDLLTLRADAIADEV
ncbi:MAG: DEAD/DEAH box helicase [Planctomycetota bacterium]|nr:MAG: DEAD/DEAH box helicase [Planctomycetota bacterium]